MLSRALKKSDIGLMIIVGLTIITIAAGIIMRWPFAMPLKAVFRFLVRTLTSIYASVPIFVLGHWTARRIFHSYPHESPTWSMLIAWTTGWAVVIILGIVLLGLGLYSIWVWIVLALLFNVITVFWLFRQKWRPIAYFRQHLLPGVLEDIIGKMTGPAGMWNIFILILLCFAFLQAMIPPNSTDELSYHLVIPRLWEFQHHWWMNADNYHLLFPANVELVWGYAFAVGGLHLPRLITLIFAIITIGGMRRWLKDLWFDPWTRGISLSFFVMTPLAVVMLSMTYVEWPMFLWIFLGWWASKRYVDTGERTYLVLTAIAWGLSVGTKYSVLPVIGLLGVEWIFRILRRFSLRHALAAFLILLAGICVFAGPWFLRNFVLTNDPIYPLGQTFPLQQRLQADPTESLNVNHLTNPENLTGFWRWNQWLYYATVSRTSDYRMHLGWPLLHCVVIILGWKIRRDKPWFTVVILSVLFFYFTPAARIFFPLMGLTWLFLPYYLNPFSQRRVSRFTLSSLIILLAIPSLTMAVYFWFMTYSRASQDYLMGFMTDDALLRKDGLITPVMQWVRQKTPVDSRIWVWCEDDVFYFERWVRPSSPYDPPAFLHIVKTYGTQALSNEIRKDDIEYIVVDITKCPLPLKTVKTETISVTVPKHLREQLDRWMKSHLKPAAKDSRFEVYQVVK